MLTFALVGCGHQPRPSAGPTPLGQVALRLDSAQVTAVAAEHVGGALSSRYVLRGRAVFRGLGAPGLRVTSLDLTWTDETGPLGHHRLPVNVVLNGADEVAIALPEVLPGPPARTPTRLLVSASAVDADGTTTAVDSVEVPLVVTAPTAPEVSSSAGDATLVAVGDIADCTLPGASLTARLAQLLPGAVLTLGDHVYPSGTDDAFAGCYDSTWGAVKGRTYPTPGNHEWEADSGAPYFRYFGAAAGPGYYSFNLGAWHVLSLNSNVAVHEGSAQYRWARTDLAANATRCTLAYWHHPLFSSGTNGDNPHMRAMWELLDEAGVDVVLAAHDHLYERFAPQDGSGRPTSAGMRQFVAGTGGGALYGVPSPRPNSEIRHNQSWGVLALRLRSGSYEWEFVSAGGHTFRDVGSAACG